MLVLWFPFITAGDNNEISIHNVTNINETGIIFLPLPLWPADVSTLLRRSFSVCNLLSCVSYLLIVASSDDILWSDSERNSLWRLWGATKMIGSCCHEGCPMNGHNEIPKILCTRHKMSQGTPCYTLWGLFKAAWISLCSCIGHVYVKGRVVQFTDEMRFAILYVNATECLPAQTTSRTLKQYEIKFSGFRGNYHTLWCLVKASWISLYSYAGHVWLSLILKFITIQFTAFAKTENRSV